MRPTSFVLLASLFALAGCDRARALVGQATGGDDASAATAAEAPTASAAAGVAEGAGRFSEELEKQKCELLTPAMVAKVSGVAEASLTTKKIAGMCRIQGGDVTAYLGTLDVMKTEKVMAERFDLSYRAMTPEEIEASMKEVGKYVDRRLDAGKIDERQARGAKAIGGMIGGTAKTGFTYKEIPGPWDKAMLDETVHTAKLAGRTFESRANKINVLVSNMTFAVHYETKDNSVTHEAELVALAKAVTEALPR